MNTINNTIKEVIPTWGKEWFRLNLCRTVYIIIRNIFFNGNIELKKKFQIQ